ncbi:radical SAM protein, partial [Candidatus Woesearchaeota archaeon]|nr:radical SAM protein [Candidatus Woesearchaeota archaeon]
MMDAVSKIKTLGAGARFDSCGCSTCIKSDDRIPKTPLQHAIYEANGEGGMKTKLFKTLMTNSCSYDCRYCNNSSSCRRRSAKAEYTPEELARTFKALYNDGSVHGLFLSSGIMPDADTAGERIVRAAEIIRRKYKFRGYIHLKVLPGENYDLVKRSAELATRVSINIEAPNKSRMSSLSSAKEYRSDMLRRQGWIRKLVKRCDVQAGQTTQMVIGAEDETDEEILKMVDWEYEEMDLQRIYFSSFSPVQGTCLEARKAADPKREFRLYNCDFLLRKYGYNAKEFRQIMDDGMLPREDPKLALARMSFEGHIDVNDITKEELMRIPGIGPKSAMNILKMRNSGSRLETKKQLKKCGVVLNRALP